MKRHFVAVHESDFGTKRTSPGRAEPCPLLGVERTSRFQSVMSAFDPKRTFDPENCCRAKMTIGPHFASRKSLL
jgi:hypothetical protein